MPILNLNSYHYYNFWVSQGEFIYSNKEGGVRYRLETTYIDSTSMELIPDGLYAEIDTYWDKVNRKFIPIPRFKRIR